jgi:hypothetical protein
MEIQNLLVLTSTAQYKINARMKMASASSIPSVVKVTRAAAVAYKLWAQVSG